VQRGFQRCRRQEFFPPGVGCSHDPSASDSSRSESPQTGGGSVGCAIRVELGDADFFDLHHSAFFNSLPVARDGLLSEDAAARAYTMRFVRVPELTAQPAWQRYEPLGNRVVRYHSSGYQADISFDADGFVTLYQDYLERVG
jgi:uncharacterized protein